MNETDILIIEDNKEISELLGDFLKLEGYQIHCCLSAEEALVYLKDHTVRLVLLDIMLPRMNGFTLCKKIREEDNVPIIILSAKNMKEDKLLGMELGADDYIEKPYDIDILIAKVHAIYRRYYKTADNSHMISYDTIKVDKDARLVWVKDQVITLTAKELDLLILFLENQGKALHKEWIFNKVWGFDSFSEPSTLTVHIKWLREKIEEDSKSPKLLHTVWGIGYRFSKTEEGIL